MDGIVYGYARVSSVDQNEDRQIYELQKWGVMPDKIYVDKLSGKDFNRPSYQRLKRKLKRGDVLVVKSIDRLGRSYRDIQDEWSVIVKKLGADIVIIDMPILDTRTNKDLIGTLISDIVLQLLSYVAETERAFIRQRQSEGIAAAKRRGVRFGRKSDVIPEGFEEVYNEWLNKKISPDEAVKRSGLTKNQFYWTARKLRMKNDKKS